MVGKSCTCLLGDGPNLMGRDWLGQFVVNLKDVHKYSDVFKDELGCLKGMPVKLLVHENAKPKFFKPRPVPILLKDKVTKELEDLQAKGIISPVQSSPWAAPVVPVLKKNGKVNQAAPTETYPLPRIEELYAKLSKTGFFGISASPAIFQRQMDTLLQGFSGVTVYIDDILVTGSSTEDHLQKLSRRHQDPGMSPNFALSSVS